jgi:hypothetical protein
MTARRDRLRRFGELLRALERARLELKRFDRVHHVDVGFRYRGGKRTDTFAIRAFIHGPKRKKGKSVRLLPRAWRGHPVDVISSTFKTHCLTAPDAQRAGVVAPLLGGISIGSDGRGAGTLGMVVRSSTYPDLLLLTCNHVADLHDQVFQPAQADSTAARLVGETFEVSASDLASLVKIRDVRALEAEILALPKCAGVVDQPTLIGLCVDREEVVKSGRSTGVTVGRLDGISDTGTISIVNPDDSPQPEIACAGDSGAVWMTRDHRAVGLHYAGEPWRACAQAMYLIQKHLALVL